MNTIQPDVFLAYVFCHAPKRVKEMTFEQLSSIHTFVITALSKSWPVYFNWTQAGVYSSIALFPDCFSLKGSTVTWVGLEDRHEYTYFDHGLPEQFKTDLVNAIQNALFQIGICDVFDTDEATS